MSDMPGSTNDEDGLPAYVRDGLLQRGIDLANEQTRKAVLVTTWIVLNKQAEHLAEIRVGHDRMQRLNFVALLFSALGFVGAILTLTSGFRQFLDAIRKLFDNADAVGFLNIVSTAFAQAAQAPLAQTSAQLAPVLVYGVYILLAIAYVVSLFNVFRGREVRDRSNAMDMFKNLNSFFIGAISGKFV
jgi:hypothetical protein